MALTRVEKERLTDSQMKIESISNSLKHVDPRKIPDFEQIKECLEDADKNLKLALKQEAPADKKAAINPPPYK